MSYLSNESKLFGTSILFIFFNREDLTLKVFEKIKQVRPTKLYLSSDGPRSGVSGENERVLGLRNVILQNINWECEVHTRFGSENLGCGLGVATAINWFFSFEERGIILEDDSLPSISFFYFCQDLLYKYENDMRVWHISGTSVIPLHQKSDSSYYFSKMTIVPGWATWKNRWDAFDIEMRGLDYFYKHDYLSEISNNFKEILWHKSTFIHNLLKINNGWGWQWYFTVLSNHGLVATPIVSLIQNIGLNRADAVHTKSSDKEWELVRANEISFPLVHPKMYCIDGTLDKYLYNRLTRYYTVPKLLRHYTIAFIKFIDLKLTGGSLYNKFINKKHNL